MTDHFLWKTPFECLLHAYHLYSIDKKLALKKSCNTYHNMIELFEIQGDDLKQVQKLIQWINEVDGYKRFNAKPGSEDKQAKQAIEYSGKFRTFQQIKSNQLKGLQGPALQSLTQQIQILVSLIQKNQDLFFDKRAPDWNQNDINIWKQRYVEALLITKNFPTCPLKK